MNCEQRANKERTNTGHDISKTRAKKVFELKIISSEPIEKSSTAAIDFSENGNYFFDSGCMRNRCNIREFAIKRTGRELNRLFTG
jgi:hypothetical protein